jgi:hypothetical protein
MAIPSELSKNDLAKLLGLTPQRIGQLTDQHVLKRNSHGLYPTTESVRAFVKHKEDAIAQRFSGSEYNEARTRKMQADAALSELALNAAELWPGFHHAVASS